MLYFFYKELLNYGWSDCVLSKLIPIYRKLNKEQVGYTILMDQQSKRVFKVDHVSINQYKFWITWAMILAFMRAIKDISLPMNHPVYYLFLVGLLGISAFIGRYKYKEVYQEKREVYYTDFLINQYINKGEANFRKEVKGTLVIFLIFVIFLILFFVFNWLPWLFFSLFIFGTFVYAACGLPPARFKLYKKEEKLK